MDEIIKQLILENKLTLTLLAMAFTPIGLWAGWRRLSRGEGAGAAAGRAARLAAAGGHADLTRADDALP